MNPPKVSWSISANFADPDEPDEPDNEDEDVERPNQSLTAEQCAAEYKNRPPADEIEGKPAIECGSQVFVADFVKPAEAADHDIFKARVLRPAEPVNQPRE